MTINIKQNTTNKKELIVQKEHTASAYGSGLVEVFATPAMVALMENTAHESVQTQLPKGFITVGMEINVQHKKATPLGKKVWCHSELFKVDGKKLHFKISAHDKNGEIGEAFHKRYILEKESFMKSLQ